MRRLLFVGRNSNPSSFQGLSSFAVPGIPNGFTSAETASEVPCLLTEGFDNGVMNAEAVASVDKTSAAENFILFFLVLKSVVSCSSTTIQYLGEKCAYGISRCGEKLKWPGMMCQRVSGETNVEK